MTPFTCAKIACTPQKQPPATTIVSFDAACARGSSNPGTGTGAFSGAALRACASASPTRTAPARTNTVRKLRNVTIYSMKHTYIAAIALGACALMLTAHAQSKIACDADNGGITLPQGFCALVVANDVGTARHMAVASNGDLLVAEQSRCGR